MEDEIDLREYINVLFRHWKLIVIITAIVVLVAGLIIFLSSSTYQATATVNILEGDQKTLVGLAKSPHVATQAIEQLGNTLNAEEQSLNSILSSVQTSERGKLIEISAKSSDPQKAVAIANAWAESYQDYVDSYYDRVLQSPEELDVLANAARQEYEEAQKALENYIGDNHVDELKRQIADKELLYNVRSLRDQIEAGYSSPASAAANNLAFILLKTSAYTNRTAGLQVSPDELSGLDASIDDVDDLIVILEERSGTQPGQTNIELRQEINGLKAEVERENVRELDLKSSRDITRKAYTSSASRVVAARADAREKATRVRVAELALVPESPVASRRVMNIGIALVLGLVISVFSAFTVEYFQKTGQKPEARKNK
jgi:capsular polysaccharide biosynthesis protein